MILKGLIDTSSDTLSFESLWNIDTGYVDTYNEFPWVSQRAQTFPSLHSVVKESVGEDQVGLTESKMEKRQDPELYLKINFFFKTVNFSRTFIEFKVKKSLL